MHTKQIEIHTQNTITVKFCGIAICKVDVVVWVGEGGVLCRNLFSPKADQRTSRNAEKTKCMDLLGYTMAVTVLICILDATKHHECI